MVARLGFTRHAHQRVYEDRTVLIEQDILEIIENDECIELRRERKRIAHLLFYSVEDSDWLVLIVDSSNGAIITVLTRSMYTKGITNEQLNDAKNRALPDVIIHAEVGAGSGSCGSAMQLVYLGNISSSVRPRNLLYWSAFEEVREIIHRHAAKRLGSTPCINLHLKVRKKGKPCMKAVVPWS
ncbi:MAG: hypothetical protein QG636_709 [Patescibacteria group bacterium]|jgi:hypothetical protein|nr:hypothetical protein [Patescibacteria group bacterium]